MTKELTRPHALLWDLDNTLYRVEILLEEEYAIAVAKAARALGVADPYETLFDLSKESFIKHRYHAREVMERYKLSHRDIHFAIDGFLDHIVIRKCAETVELFSGLDLPHSLITHSSRRWALRTLQALELLPFFPENRIFALEDYEFRFKSESQKSFEMALAAVDRDPSGVMIVEDTLANLRIPHEMGMTTVFLHHGQVPESIPAYVDFSFSNTPEFLRTLSDRPS